MKKYPKIQSIDKDFDKLSNEYNWKAGCQKCKGKFEEEEKFVRVDVATDYMRGDDDVYCFHNSCFDEGLRELKKGYGIK